MLCLNSQLRKFHQITYNIYKKQTFIAIKTNFTHKNLKDIFMYEEKKRSPLTAFLDTILYQGSLIYC